VAPAAAVAAGFVAVVVAAAVQVHGCSAAAAAADADAAAAVHQALMKLMMMTVEHVHPRIHRCCVMTPSHSLAVLSVLTSPSPAGLQTQWRDVCVSIRQCVGLLVCSKVHTANSFRPARATVISAEKVKTSDISKCASAASTHHCSAHLCSCEAATTKEVYCALQIVVYRSAEPPYPPFSF
jgi:hypothetical protein